uniref:Peptidase S1 domain-containing protein n=1 Tax=Xenopus tropicalis TaxID=8364 RepID=A0A6I8R2H4_XENTR
QEAETVGVSIQHRCRPIGGDTAFSVSPTDCGNKPKVKNFQRGVRIIGGHYSQAGAWPWAVSIQHGNGKDYTHFCGGSILNVKWVLTAASCFTKHKKLVFGAHHLARLGPEVQFGKIKQLIIHENYSPIERPTHDIALVELEAAIKYNDYTQPACIPAITVNVEEKDDCYVSAWGFLNESPTETLTIMQEAQVNIIPKKTCNSKQWYKGKIKDFSLCAHYTSENSDSCLGDVGGPLTCRRIDAYTYMVVGIAGSGYGCPKEKQPHVYTATQHYIEWIGVKIYGDKNTQVKVERSKRSEPQLISFPHLITQSPTTEDQVTLFPLQTTPFLQTKKLKRYLANAFELKAAAQFKTTVNPNEDPASSIQNPSAPTPLLDSQLFVDTSPAQNVQVTPTPEPAFVDLLQSLWHSLMKMYRHIIAYVRGLTNGHQADFS